MKKPLSSNIHLLLETSIVLYNDFIRKERMMMKMSISQDAAKWYKDEMQLKDGDFLRFFARYGGCGNVQKGFSLGVAKDEPVEIGVETSCLGVTFFVEEKDLWYFDSRDLTIELDPEHDEPVFYFS